MVDQIENLSTRLKEILPEGWEASRCFNLNPFNGKTSPERILISPPYRKKFSKSPAERLLSRILQQEVAKAGAVKLAELLGANGFKVALDGASVYVTGTAKTEIYKEGGKPAGVMCKCGCRSPFSSWVYAHWNERIKAICPNCHDDVNLLRGVIVAPKRNRKSSSPSAS